MDAHIIDYEVQKFRWEVTNQNSFIDIYVYNTFNCERRNSWMALLQT